MSHRAAGWSSSTIAALIAAALCAATVAPADDGPPRVRVATYNTSLNRNRAGQLVEDLRAGSQQAQRVAEVLQRVRPDLVLLNEFDYDTAQGAAQLFCEQYLAKPQAAGLKPLHYEHRLALPVNTGLPSGRDLNKDGELDGPADSVGFGRHHGQYGMLLLSRFPIRRQQLRTFQRLLWREMPGALLPTKDGQPYYGREDLKVLRLSSKSHWDVPVRTPLGELHVLASHPTPPVFDGAEDRNGRRNFDELRLWADYLHGGERARYLRDDQGVRGGLDPQASFVILGDLNADPQRGDSRAGAVTQLLNHPRVLQAETPQSDAAGPATALFGRSGRFRVDYVLPSRDLAAPAGGVFWPAAGTPGHEAAAASDHRLVWRDLVLCQG